MAKVERNAYGAVVPSAKRDTADIVALARGFMEFRRCPGGRLVIKGYVCSHCGIDYTAREPDEVFCGQPVDEDGFTVLNAALARSRMEAGDHAE